VNITSKTIAYTFFNQAVPQSGTGSGVIIDYAGHIVTNYHVVEGAESLEVTLADKSVHNARPVGADPNNDLAVIQIDVPKDKLSPIPLGSSKGLQVGQKVLAIGNPYRMDHTLTTGIISALGRTFETQNKRIVEGVIQTDAAINPGNSGGPLLNAAGEVIGINSQILSSGGGSVGIGFAIPVETVKRVTTDLITLGYVRRPYMGIGNVGSIEENRGFAELNQIEPKGLLILEVVPGTPADMAGLIPGRPGIFRGYRTYVGGDIILAMDGVEVNSVGELGAVIDRHKAGEQVKITILRAGKKIQIPLTLQEAPRPR
jgi:putative serine protease PepD